MESPRLPSTRVLGITLGAPTRHKKFTHRRRMGSMRSWVRGPIR